MELSGEYKSYKVTVSENYDGFVAKIGESTEKQIKNIKAEIKDLRGNLETYKITED